MHRRSSGAIWPARLLSIGFSVMRLLCGCDAESESLCEMNDVMTLWCRRCSLRLWLAAELEGDPCVYSFGAGRDSLRQAGTLRGTQARFGAATFACCVLGRSWSPNGFGKAFAKRWIPQTIEFSKGFERIPFQTGFRRWVFLLQICSLFTFIW